MTETTIIGLDIAKNVFQLHGADAQGAVKFRKKLSRAQVLPFLQKHRRCTVALEACSTAHHWGREIEALGHAVKLIPPIYVKPFVKRQKNDMADAEAIAEAASRPTMRFVAIKTPEQQARMMIFRTRELLVRQRTQTINALRSQLAEHGIIAPKGKIHLKRLVTALEEETDQLPALVRSLADVYLTQIKSLSEKIAEMEKALKTEARKSKATKRLQTMPGLGPITAMAIESFAPPMEEFKRGRDFAAWLGLVPRQHSSGGKDRLGKTSKMGQRDIRRLLICGAMAVISWAIRKGGTADPWLARMLEKKPRLVVATALANKMARAIWAMMTRGEDYRGPVGAAA